MAGPLGALDRRRVDGAAPPGRGCLDRRLPRHAGVLAAPRAAGSPSVVGRGDKAPTDARRRRGPDTRRRITHAVRIARVGQGLAALDDAVVGHPALAPDERSVFVVAARHVPRRRREVGTTPATTEQAGEERAGSDQVGKHSQANSPSGSTRTPRRPSARKA